METHHQQTKSRLDLFRQKVYIIIYGVNTPAGKAFDIGLLIVILLSVFTIMLETVEGIDLIFLPAYYKLSQIAGYKAS